MVVGWYHSHPGFGCWLSGVDINTQQSFEALSERAVAVVVDPIQSVKGKVRLVTKIFRALLKKMFSYMGWSEIDGKMFRCYGKPNVLRIWLTVKPLI